MGLGGICVFYYRNRLHNAVLRKGGAFSKTEGYGKQTTREMNKLYNDERFRQWKNSKHVRGQDHEREEDHERDIDDGF